MEALAVIAGVIAVAGGAYALGRAGPAARDARGRGLPWLVALRLAVREVVRPGSYWWGERLERLRPGEAAHVLAAETARLGVGHVTDARCGLCGATMAGVLTLDPAGALTARRESVCAACGFRLDACRFCVHFQPHGASSSAPFLYQTDDSQGRCQLYRAWQPVERVAAPQLARKLQEMGYDGFNTAAVIQDSYVPLDECRAFALDDKKTRRAGLKNLDRRRAALIRLVQQNFCLPGSR